MILLLVTYSPIAHWHPPSFGDRSPRQAEAGAERRGVTKPGLPPPGVGVALARQPLGSGERKSLSQLQHPELQRALRQGLKNGNTSALQPNLGGLIAGIWGCRCCTRGAASVSRYKLLFIRKLWQENGWISNSISTHCGKTTLHSSLLMEATYPVTWRNTLFLVWRHTGSPLGELPSNCKCFPEMPRASG
ncbi:uncharacterized protein LOC129404909 isoform X11 [Sorex araneus]|uniref:uncharacterized protein LOC129404909 isoform X11 n=1 Tax=Sorex araneus TaxID=42254 RepID=UPI0024339525|nr:uncharacterized protein LOC129404909 isoform X11 [Sorex araneus]